MFLSNNWETEEVIGKELIAHGIRSPINHHKRKKYKSYLDTV